MAGSVAFIFGLVSFVVLGVVADARAQADDTAVREAIKYICFNVKLMDKSEITNYYSLDDKDNELRLRTPGGEIIIDVKDVKLDDILLYTSIKACEEGLLNALVPAPAQTESNGSEQTPVRVKSFSFSEWNTHCAEDTPFEIPVRVSEGWRIVPSSIDVTNVRSSSESSVEETRDATGDGFTIVGSLGNSGHCGPFWRDARGHVWGAVHYTETWRTLP